MQIAHNAATRVHSTTPSSSCDCHIMSSHHSSSARSVQQNAIEDPDPSRDKLHRHHQSRTVPCMREPREASFFPVSLVPRLPTTPVMQRARALLLEAGRRGEGASLPVTSSPSSSTDSSQRCILVIRSEMPCGWDLRSPLSSVDLTHHPSASAPISASRRGRHADVNPTRRGRQGRRGRVNPPYQGHSQPAIGHGCLRCAIRSTSATVGLLQVGGCV